jgi:hypothetical protein
LMRVFLALKSPNDIVCAIALAPNSKQAAIAMPLRKLRDFSMVIL